MLVVLEAVALAGRFGWTVCQHSRKLRRLGSVLCLLDAVRRGRGLIDYRLSLVMGASCYWYYASWRHAVGHWEIVWCQGSSKQSVCRVKWNEFETRVMGKSR